MGKKRAPFTPERQRRLEEASDARLRAELKRDSWQHKCTVGITVGLPVATPVCPLCGVSIKDSASRDSGD